MSRECERDAGRKEGKSGESWLCCQCGYETRQVRSMERQFHMRACSPDFYRKELEGDLNFRAYLAYLQGRATEPHFHWLACPRCGYHPPTGDWGGFERQFHMRICDASFFKEELDNDTEFQQYVAYLQGISITPTISRPSQSDEDGEDEGDGNDSKGDVGGGADDERDDRGNVTTVVQHDWRLVYRREDPDSKMADVYVGISPLKNDHKWCNVRVGRGLFAAKSIGFDTVVHAIVFCKVLPSSQLKSYLRARRLPYDAAIQMGELSLVDLNIRGNDDLMSTLRHCEWYAMNHSHDPNVRMYRRGTLPNIRIEWRTTRNVKQDEELHYDYFGRGLKWEDNGWR
mmetsp:Transcript_10652/g.21446  ORF Transcript_10652/g.21446 Transcript_10652/m.21446 type:complete len:342 (-) Transcript_10652:1319-2344(-)